MNIKDTAGLAAQIVFEYPEWGDEHIDDFMRTYSDCGDTAPCDGDELYDASHIANKLKNDGLDYKEVIDRLMEQLRKGF